MITSFHPYGVPSARVKTLMLLPVQDATVLPCRFLVGLHFRGHPQDDLLYPGLLWTLVSLSLFHIYDSVHLILSPRYLQVLFRIFWQSKSFS